MKSWNAINGTTLTEGADIAKDVSHLSDDVQDEKDFDIKKIEKYCHQSSWQAMLEKLEWKQICKWYCSSCPKTRSKGDESIAGERYPISNRHLIPCSLYFLISHLEIFDNLFLTITFSPFENFKSFDFKKLSW